MFLLLLLLLLFNYTFVIILERSKMFGIRRQTVNQSINHQVNKIESVSILSQWPLYFWIFLTESKNVRTAFASFRAHFSSRALSVFPTLSLDAYGHLLWDGDETLRRELKIRLAAEYFWRNSRCFIWWWNTVSNAWYYFSNKMILEIGIKDAKLSS